MRFSRNMYILAMSAALVLSAARECVCARNREYIDAAKKVAPAVVSVINGKEVGSGVIVRREGYILTAAHVIKKATTVKVIKARY